MSQLLRKRGALILLAFWLIAYLIPLGWRPLVQPEELRHAELAREILVSGDWVVHRISDLRYFDKPPLGHWLNAISLWLFGENAFAVRLVSCLCIGLIAAALLRFTHNYTGSHNAGLIAGLVFLSSPGALAMANYAVYEGIVSLWLTLGLLTFYHASHARSPDQSILLFALFGVLCGLAFLTNGFIAIIIPVTIVIPFMIWERRFEKLMTYGWIAILAGFAITLPWSLLINAREPDFWHYYLWIETLDQLTGSGSGGAEHYWYFLPLAAGFPWSLLLIGKPLRCLMGNDNADNAQLTRFCYCWLVIALLLFVFSRGKLIQCALICLPPLAILLGLSAAQLIREHEVRLFQNGIQVSAAFLVLLLFIAVLNFTAGLGEPVWRAHETVEWIWLCGILCFWIATLRLALTTSLRSRHWVIALGVAPAFSLIPLYLPELVYAGRMPGVFLKEQAPAIAEDTIVATDATLLSAVSWYFKRTDIVLVGNASNYDYALSYADTQHRRIEFADFDAFIEKTERPVAYFEKFSTTPPTNLPSGASEGAMGRFILYRHYPAND
jgi:4-amino-4-deoxy-L-arabinose transferase